MKLESQLPTTIYIFLQPPTVVYPRGADQFQSSIALAFAAHVRLPQRRALRQRRRLPAAVVGAGLGRTFTQATRAPTREGGAQWEAGHHRGSSDLIDFSRLNNQGFKNNPLTSMIQFNDYLVERPDFR